MTHCQAWFLLKFLEIILGMVCAYFHIEIISLPEEHISHNLYLCGTFYGFILISFFGMISIYFAGRVPAVQMEALGNYFAASTHYLAAILVMYDIENDYHLMFLGNIEEMSHTYYVSSVRQSVSALILGSLYLLHALFATDVILVPINDPDYDDDDDKYREGLEVPPIKIFILGKWLHDRFDDYHWYHRMGGKKYAQKRKRNRGFY